MKDWIEIKFLCIFLLQLFVTFSFAQDKANDSLIAVINKSPEDTNKVIALNEITYNLRKKNPQKALEFGQQALELSEKLNYKKGLANSHNYLGVIYYVKSDFNKAQKHYEKALKLRQELNDQKGIAASLGNIGMIYDKKADYTKALQYYLQSLKIREDIHDQEGVAKTLNNIGICYYNQNDTNNALLYYKKGLKICKQLNDNSGIAQAFNNIGLIYYDKGNLIKGEYDLAKVKTDSENKIKSERYFKEFNAYYDTSLYYNKSALQIQEKAGYKFEISKLLTNIGNIYGAKKEYNKAMDYYNKTIELQKEIGDMAGYALSLSNIGDIFYRQASYIEAINYYEKSLSISKTINYRDLQQNIYNNLAKVYEKTKNFQQAFDYLKKYSNLHDSIFNEDLKNKITEMQTKYDTESKEKENELLKKEGELTQIQLEKNQTRVYFLLIVVLLILALSFIVFRGYRQKQKANKLLTFQNAEIAAQKEEITKQRDEIGTQKDVIELKNKNITDSIKYAQRIQKAILPPNEYISKHLQNYFILYRPKAIVSGDFYWVEYINNKVLFAAVDCTGHGVPGAFMSIVGNNLLNQAVNEHNYSEPAQILNFLNAGVHKTLRQSEDDASVKDGMDIALCSYDAETKKIKYAGAYNPLYLIRNNQVIEYKATKHPVGKPFDERIKEYTDISIDIEIGDTIYIFSDGYIDQFRGLDGKKFMSKQLKDKLLEYNHLPMDQIRELMNNVFENWKGESDQIDDVLLFGVRFL